MNRFVIAAIVFVALIGQAFSKEDVIGDRIEAPFVVEGVSVTPPRDADYKTMHSGCTASYSGTTAAECTALVGLLQLYWGKAITLRGTGTLERSIARNTLQDSGGRANQVHGERYAADAVLVGEILKTSWPKIFK